LFAFIGLGYQANAVKHTVLVGNYYFNPSNLPSVNLGDTIRWEWVAGSHTTTSTSIPSGASTWDEPITFSNQVYEYKTTVAGTYNYVCLPHAGMGQVGSFTVQGAAPLAVTATANPGNVCIGGSTQLNAIVSGGTGTYTYSWTSIPAGFTSNLKNPVAFPTQNTTYIVSVTSGSQNESANTSVTTQSLPDASAGNDTMFCINVTEFTIEGSASNYSSVNWSSTGDGSFVNGNTLLPTYLPGATDLLGGTITLILTAQSIAPCENFAVDSMDIVLDPCAAINDKDNSVVGLNVYPNPTSGMITVSADTKVSSVTIRIVDMQGKVMIAENIAPSGAAFSKSFDLSAFPKGIYHVGITAGNTTTGKKVLVR
jgi:plastocyanin